MALVKTSASSFHSLLPLFPLLLLRGPSSPRTVPPPPSLLPNEGGKEHRREGGEKDEETSANETQSEATAGKGGEGGRETLGKGKS